MQPDSAVNSLLSAMSNTCFLLDRVLLSLGYVQCNLMTLQSILQVCEQVTCLPYETCCRLASVSALDRPICGGLQKRLRDLALEAALDRPKHRSRWAAEWGCL